MVLARWLWPLLLPIGAKIGLSLVLLVASQYHLWSKLSSGSVFAPEFPRAIIILFNWACGAILLLAVLQIMLDLGSLVTAVARRRPTGAPDGLRYVIAGLAALLAAIGVAGALRVPTIKDVEIAVGGLPPQVDGYPPSSAH